MSLQAEVHFLSSFALYKCTEVSICLPANSPAFMWWVYVDLHCAACMNLHKVYKRYPYTCIDQRKPFQKTIFISNNPLVRHWKPPATSRKHLKYYHSFYWGIEYILTAYFPVPFRTLDLWKFKQQPDSDSYFRTNFKH